MIPAYWLLSLKLNRDKKAEAENDLRNSVENIVASTELLQKEKAQLARLLDAESIDLNAVFSLINRLIQARAK